MRKGAIFPSPSWFQNVHCTCQERGRSVCCSRKRLMHCSILIQTFQNKIQQCFAASILHRDTKTNTAYLEEKLFIGHTTRCKLRSKQNPT